MKSHAALRFRKSEQSCRRVLFDASEVIAWADEVIVAAPKTEGWMIEISICGPEDPMKVLSQLNTVKGEADQAELKELLKAKGIS